MEIRLREEWRLLLKNEFESEYFKNLLQFVLEEYRQHIVYPPEEKIFNAFNHTGPQQVKVVIIGQDPYHGPNQANGLCFSVNEGVKIPPSLLNIFKELQTDFGIPKPESGNLEKWANQGVLLLNATLTVRAAQAGSHQKKGWENFTDAAIQNLANTTEGLVFMLWGNNAQQKAKLIDDSRHLVLTAAHPSPLSAYNGFFGCKHFSKANAYLKYSGRKTVDWNLA
jgi:uracil-DNA glycosylase